MKHNDYEGFCKVLNDSIDNYRNRIQQLPRKDIYEKYSEIQAYEKIYDYLINEYTNYNIKYLYKENIMDFLYNKYKKTLYGLVDQDLNDFLEDVIKEERKLENDKSDVKYLIKGKLYSPILYGDEEDVWGDVEEGDRCGDCGCEVGQMHFENCDIERCPACQLQFISCDCGIKYVVTKAALKNLPKLIKQQEIDNIEYEKKCEEAIREYEDRVEKLENEKKRKKKKSEAEM